jgi:hypothetical protein
MPFIKYVLEDNIPCPRCNADSQIRVEDKEDFCIIVHVCKMCRYKKSLRITTRRALELEEREKMYIELLNSGLKIEKNYKILARLKKVQKQKELLELGIRRENGRRKNSK